MSRDDDAFDVLVVGFGPVGATVCCLLGQYGVRVLVIDKADGIYLHPRAIALDNEALRILQLAGLPTGAFETLPIPTVRLHCPYVGQFAEIDTSGTIDGHPKLVTFHQPSLEAALRATVATHPTVTVATGVELVHFDDMGDSVRATLRTIDGERRVQARFLVGADGARSTVRRATGQRFEGQTHAEEWLVVDARNVPGTFDHVEFLCDPNRPTPHMVAPDGRIRWEFMLRPGETKDHMEREDTIRQLLAPWDPTGRAELERVAVYRFHARSCDAYRVGSVFLAGDAAHLTPPFAGQGLVSGLRDAINLAWKLSWVLCNRVSERILDSYDEERRPHALKMIGLARFMGALIMPRSHAIAALVHGALRLGQWVPGIRRQLTEMRIKPPHAFDKGLFVSGRGRYRRGGWFPQVRLGVSGRDNIWSDDVLGPGFALVGLGGDIRLSSATQRTWETLGGRIVTLDMAAPPPAWCAVVRPDRTIVNDGPACDAERVTRQALACLASSGSPAHGG
ncbi:MAG: bifunctional 3-(3-hydroxy-phenyl)propionate/3-hydroxycinnamic acid hydroxylase [Myxococcota bacterium]